MIDLSDKYLLMIEPSSSATDRYDEDDLTTLMQRLMLRAARKDFTRGFHTCVCGARSDNAEHVLPDGTVTNSLAVHYLMRHRAEVPQSELDKIRRLARELLGWR